MENKFESLTIFEFQERFPDAACCEYLIGLKWKDGFVCPFCGHTHYCASRRKYDRQCTSCHRAVSPTSQTLFHQLKFPILKAFYIVYYLSTSKKGISSTELSRKTWIASKNMLVVQAKSNESHEKQWQQ